jgi:hypothetical protein
MSTLSEFLGFDLNPAQEAKKGFRLTTKQNLKLLPQLIKKHGAPDIWTTKGTLVHRVWNVGSDKVAVEYDSDGSPALVYLVP